MERFTPCGENFYAFFCAIQSYRPGAWSLPSGVHLGKPPIQISHNSISSILSIPSILKLPTSTHLGKVVEYLPLQPHPTTNHHKPQTTTTMTTTTTTSPPSSEPSLLDKTTLL